MNALRRSKASKTGLPSCAALLLSLLAVAALPCVARAQWTTSGTTTSTTNNVGVGTAQPESILHITDTSTVGNNRGITVDNISDSALSSPIYLRKSRGTPLAKTSLLNGDAIGTLRGMGFDGTNFLERAKIQFIINGAVSTDNMPTDIQFMTGTNGSPGEKMRITSAGNVGIGTTSPSARLHLSAGNGEALRFTTTGNSQGANAQVGVSTYGDSTGGAVYLGPNFYLSPGGALSRYDASSIGWGFGFDNRPSVDAARFFRVAADGTITTPFIINGSGNVGVGTASPTARLQVAGDITASGTLSSGRTASGVYLWDDGSGGNVGALSGGTNARNLSVQGQNLIFFSGATYAEKMRITSTGNVGVGTALPSYKLDVAGQVRSSSGGFVFPDGTTQATALSYGSTAGTAVQGNTTLTLSAGTGMSGGGTATLGAGGTLTLTNADPGSSQSIFKNVANAAGAAQFSAGSNNDTLRFEGTGGTSVSFDAATKKVTINSAAAASSGWTDGGSSVSLTNTSANVGIGTGSPSARLHLSAGNGEALRFTTTGNSQGANAQVGVSTYGDSTGGLIYLGPNFYLSPGGALSRYDTGSAAWGFGFDNRPSVDAAKFFRVAGDGTITTPFIINGSGNVGVGTATPSTSLEVTRALAGNFNGLFVYNSAAAPYNSGDSVSLSLGRSQTNVMAQLTSSNKVNGTFGDGYLAFSTRRADVVAERMRIDENGNVGIGKTNPSNALDVVGAISTTGAITAGGAITGATVNATYQDVAEWVPSTQKLSAGTVVVLDTTQTNHVLASTKAYDTGVAGVVSDSPGVILGQGGDGKLKVATTGRVKVRVDATRAPIKVGDLLVTSGEEGVAMKSVPVDLGGTPIHRPGTIIGKALEPLEKGTGEILVLLSLQ